jgi:serine protease AprX
LTDFESDPDMLEAARSYTRRTYGSAVAEKATDSFLAAVLQREERSAGVLAHAAAEVSRRGTRAFMEVLGRPLSPRSMVGSAPLPSIVEFERQRPRAQVLAEGERRPKAGSDEPMTRAGKAAERTRRVQEMRNAGYQAVAGVYNEIERSSTAALGLAPGMVDVPRIQTLITQFCWLNRTVRTWAGPEALTEVSCDDSVERIDLPRPILFEADIANHVAIGLPTFLEANGLTGRGVTVGVIDSEIALHHPALKGRVVQRSNYTSEPWGNPDSHGTAVAGIIGAKDSRFPGIAPDVTMYNYKIVPVLADDFDGAQAIADAVDDGVDVINCSWGTKLVTDGKSREAGAVDAAWSVLTAVVKSAGNRGPGPSTLTTPADAEDIIVVGATDLEGKQVQPYSSRGPANAVRRPEIVAPGGDDERQIACCLVDGGFGHAGSGTSYAAPHVTGAIALLLEKQPGLDPDQLRSALLESAKRLSHGTRNDQGRGLLRLV